MRTTANEPVEEKEEMKIGAAERGKKERTMTNEELKRDAARYWRLRVLGCAPCETKQLENGTVLRFSNLDEFIDHDIKIRPSRGEAEIYENKTEGVAVSASPQPRCPKCGKETQGYISACDFDGGEDYVLLGCCGKFPINKDGHPFPVLEDLSQFFAAAPAQEPRPPITDAEINATLQDLASCFADDRSPVMGERTRQMCQSAYALIVGLYAKVNLLPAAQEQPVENSPEGSLKDFSVAKALDGFSKEPPQPTVFSPQKGKP